MASDQRVDMIMLQECGLHETGCDAVRALLDTHVAESGSFQRCGPWELHHHGAYSTIVSKRKILQCTAQLCKIFDLTFDAETPDPQWGEKWPGTELHSPAAARPQTFTLSAPVCVRVSPMCVPDPTEVANRPEIRHPVRNRAPGYL